MESLTLSLPACCQVRRNSCTAAKRKSTFTSQKNIKIVKLWLQKGAFGMCFFSINNSELDFFFIFFWYFTVTVAQASCKSLYFIALCLRRMAHGQKITYIMKKNQPHCADYCICYFLWTHLYDEQQLISFPELNALVSCETQRLKNIQVMKSQVCIQGWCDHSLYWPVIYSTVHKEAKSKVPD